MKENKISPAQDLHEAGKLVTEAAGGITQIVQDVHFTIVDKLPIPGASLVAGRNSIAVLIYRLIQKILGMAGNGVSSMLRQMETILEKRPASPEREAIIAALNGVLGDYLHARESTLTVPMQWKQNGLPVDENQISMQIPETNGKLLIMVHGSCMNDMQWTMKGHNHGLKLAAEFGYTPLFLHYNTGLHISDNGEAFALKLESLLTLAPKNTQIVFLLHSMGGLITRSAMYFAQLHKHTWLKHTSKVIFLGTPHQGAPLEQGGNWVTLLLQSNPWSTPLAKLGKIRSAGITDMRYGNITHHDWHNRDRFNSPGDRRLPVALPSGIQYYVAAAIFASEQNLLANHLVGDGLVPLQSALGKHRIPEKQLLFKEENTWIGYQMGHLELLYREELYQKLRDWMKQ